MSKAISLSGLKTLLEPLVHLINKKAERPDWNENDPSSPDYIENRPFYEIKENKTPLEFIADSTAGINFSDNGYVGYAWSNQNIGDSPFPSGISDTILYDGEEYTVNYNSQVYKFNADSYDGITWIGNGYIMFGSPFEDNGLDFCIVSDSTENFSFVLLNNLRTAQMSISGVSKIIHKIDEKYLPESKGANIGMAGSGQGAEIFNNYDDNTASGQYSHAEGQSTTASGNDSHAEGSDTIAYGNHSHAEGNLTTANGIAAHVEGQCGVASGDNSHAEGYETYAKGGNSHSEGRDTHANGLCSHAEGDGTIAAGERQHVQGKYNISDTISAHIVGNGTDIVHSNAHTLDWQGNAWYAGDVYVGSTSGTNKDEGSKKLATEFYVNEKIAAIDISNQIAEHDTSSTAHNDIRDLITAPKNSISFIDQVNGYIYIACMREGNLVTYCAAKSIEVTSMPNKTKYMAGEYFDPTGMVVTATSYDGITREVTDFICPSSYITEGSTSIEIKYVEAGVVNSTTIPITVNAFDAATVLVDFDYTANDDGTYTITGWKGTLNGEVSTEIIIPDNGLIIV